MKKTGNFRGVFKKTSAVMLSMIMVFGAVSVLPRGVVSDNAIVAHAEKDRSKWNNIAVNDCIFYYSFDYDNEANKIVIIEDCDILNADGIVKIPATILNNGTEYTVTTLGWEFLRDNQEVKNVIMPNTIKETSAYVLWNTSIEKLTISDNLEYMGWGFCDLSPELKRENVTYNGNKLTYARALCFYNSPGMVNEKGAVVLNNWLFRYEPKDNETTLKIADLGTDGVKIDRMAASSVAANKLTSVDLEGVEIMCDSNFVNHKTLKTVRNYDSIISLGAEEFEGTPWLEAEKQTGTVRLGNGLIYHKSDAKVIDLTAGELKGIKTVRKGALTDCKNADTIICTSDSQFITGCFYEAHKQSEDRVRMDYLPEIPTYKIKTIYLDGKELVCTKEKPDMPLWIVNNFDALKGTAWLYNTVEAKTKILFEQLDIPFYGIHNDKAGTLSPTEAFYTELKLHAYLSTYDYDHGFIYRGGLSSFLVGGRVTCEGYAENAALLLDCAGVWNKIVGGGAHAWNIIKFGDEIFEFDDGWDEQGGHTFTNFAMSTSATKEHGHKYERTIGNWHDYKEVDQFVNTRVLGDLNGDDKRDQTDVNRLWDYIKGDIKLKDPKLADINFDGVVDVTDAILIQNFVTGPAVDPEKYPLNKIVTDGLSPGFRVVYLDTEDTDYVDIQYDWTDSDGYIVLPEVMYDVPEGKKFGGWNYGQEGKPTKAGQKVKIKNPYTLIQPVWKNESDPDDVDYVLGDVDGSGTIDISDVSKLINHINGVKALDEEEFLRADVNKSSSVEISDASAIVNHINGVKAIEGTV